MVGRRPFGIRLPWVSWGWVDTTNLEGVLTIHVAGAISLTDETFRGPEDVPEGNKETDILHDLDNP